MMKTYRFASYSRYVGKKRNADYYAWCLYLDATLEKLREIRQVEYTLHPTFPDPVRSVSEPEHCFALQSEGWGDFEVYMRVFSVDGDLTRLVYPLELKRDNWPRGTRLTGFDDEATRRVYEGLLEEEWEWRKLSTLARYGDISLGETGAILGRLADKRAVRKAYFLSLEGEELWGATHRVGLLPEPK
jgi:hypothetical protein